MNDNLEKLLQLQGIDSEIAGLKAKNKTIAGKLEQSRKERSARESAIKKLEMELASNLSARRKAEIDLKAAEEQSAKYNKQLTYVKTPKELDAVNHEIEAAQMRASGFEETVLELMDAESRLSGDLEALKKKSAQQETESSEQETRLGVLKTENDALLKNLGQDRIVAANALEEEIRETYEWIMSKNTGSAVARLDGEACTGCGGILVPHLVVEIRQGRTLSQCTHCHRYLYS